LEGSAIRGIRQKKNLVAEVEGSLNRHKSLKESVGLVRHSGASANEWKKNPALFYFLALLLVISSCYVTFAAKFFN